MSNYIRRTKHPDTGVFEDASWIDDHFGKHNYGVRFPSKPDITWKADTWDWEFEDAVPKSEALVPGSERWNFLAWIHFQAKHMESSDAIIFLNKYVKEEIV